MGNIEFNDLSLYLHELLSGNLSIINAESIGRINTIALRLYDTDINNYTQSDIKGLEIIIRISNILYNRTDRSLLALEDGFYDLLLEKHKKLNPNFQVGSDVVDFTNGRDNTLPYQRKEIICPIEFVKPRDTSDELRNDIYNKITLDGVQRYNERDLYKSPITFEAAYINKRLHNIEHNHPTLVGTLDKAKFVLNKDAIEAGAFEDDNVKVLERDFFYDHISKGVYHPDRELTVICELKYDGVSVEADCNFTVQSARSRGDTGIGSASDMTPILKDYIFKQAYCMIGEEPIGVKFEAIMTKSDLHRFNVARNRNYANCRTAIVGLFGASDAYLFKDYITLIPLALDVEQFNELHPNTPIRNRLEEIEFINKVFVSHGEPLRYCVFTGKVQELLYLIKIFVDEAKYARDFLNFMYDGVVVSIYDNDIRDILGRKNSVNKYSMAVKFDPLEKQTTFRGYTFEVGQHGDITPMIHYDPVEFFGTIHTKSTGSSLNRFKELNLKVGDIINVTYVNDVMPYVTKSDCQHNIDNPNPVHPFITHCPACGAALLESTSGKSAYCPNHNCPARTIQRMTNMFAKMNIKGFAAATFSALNKTNLRDICSMSEQELVSVIGEADGKALYQVISSLYNDIWKDYIIMGALGFGGIARKKWEDILNKVSLQELHDNYQMLLDTCNSGNEVSSKFAYFLSSKVPNIGEVTLQTIVNEFPHFFADIKFIVQNVHLENSLGVDKSGRIQVRFTGFRNLQLVEQLNTLGFDAGEGSITKNTNVLLIPYTGFSSSKVTKAMKIPNILILTEQEFRDRFNIS